MMIFGESNGVTADGTLVGVDDDLVPFPAVAGDFTISSTSENDTGAGTGCQICRCEGICELNSGERVIRSENISMGGTGPQMAFLGVAGVLRIRSMFSVQTGNPESPAPDGDVTASIDGEKVHRMKAGSGQSMMVVFSTGSNRAEGIISTYGKIVKPGGGAPNLARAQLWYRPKGASWIKAGIPLVLDKDGGEGIEFRFNPSFSLPMECDVKLDVPSTGGDEINVFGQVTVEEM